MERKRRQQCADEPAVTFELEETPQERSRSRLGAAGTVAVSGAGLIASGATPDLGESLDVFDAAESVDEAIEDEADSESGSTESFDPAYPPIDFAESTGEQFEVDSDDIADVAVDAVFGASSDVGGGFSLDDAQDDALFGASGGDPDLDIVPDSLVDDDIADHDADADPDDLDDDDLN